MQFILCIFVIYLSFTKGLYANKCTTTALSLIPMVPSCPINPSGTYISHTVGEAIHPPQH